MPSEDSYDHVMKANQITRLLMAKYFSQLTLKLKPLEISSSLDVGCGKGYVTNYIRMMSGRAPFALDYSADKIIFIRREYPLIPLVIGDGTRLPFPDEAFDLVIATQVLEHQERPAEMLEEMVRVTRRYGFFTVPNEPFWRIANFLRGKYVANFGNSPEHKQHWSRKSFEKLLQEHFSNVNVESVYVWNFALCEK